MSKKINRVLSFALAILMVMSMASVFTFTASAQAVDFKTNYVCSDGNDTIKNTAVLLYDSSATVDGTTVTATWEDTEYTFTIGENAFASLTDIETAITNGTIAATPQVIVPSWNGVLAPTVSMKFYAPNWNTCPYVRPADWTALKYGTTAWTANETYHNRASNAIITRLHITASVTGALECYGFQFSHSTSNTYPVDDRNRTEAAQIVIKNCFSNQIYSSYYFYNGKCSANQIADLANNSLLIENLWLADNDTDANVRIVGEFMPHNTVIRGMYIDSSVGNKLAASSTNYIKTLTGSSLTFEGCYFPSTTNGHFGLQGASSNSGAIDSGKTREVVLRNNVFNDFASTTGYFLWLDEADHSGITVEDNYIIYPNATTTGVGLFKDYGSGSSARADGSVKIINNKIIGIANNFAVSNSSDKLDIYGNFYLPTYTADYQSATGQAITAANGLSGDTWYWFDYAMTQRSDVLAYELAGAAGTEDIVEIDNTNKIIDYIVKSNDYTTLSGDTYTIDTDFITATAGYTLKFGETAHGETINVTKTGITDEFTFTISNPANTLTETWTVKMHYLADVEPFNEGYSNSTIQNTAVLLYDDYLFIEGTTIYEEWEGTVYSFEQGVNAFDSINAIPANSQVLVPSWNGSFNITKPMKFYGVNWNTAPFNRPDGENWSAVKSGSTAWTVNPNFDTTSSVATAITVATDFEGGALEFYGFYITGKITDSTRTNGANIVLKNIYHKANTHLIDFGGNIGTTIANNNPSLTKQNNSILLKNYYAVGTKANTKFMSRYVPHSTTLDSVWVDFTNLYYQNWIKFAKTDTEYIWKNSYLTGYSTASGNPLNFQGIANQLDASLTATLEFSNNTFYNFSASTVVDGVFSVIKWESRSFSAVKFHDNYVAAPAATTVKFFDQTHTKNAKRQPGAVSITGNIFNGMQDEIVMKYLGADGTPYADTDAVEIQGNFLLTTYTADYANAEGEMLKVEDPLTYHEDRWYWLDAAMTRKAVVAIGDTGYETVAQANEDAKAGDTIFLLTDATTDVLTLTAGANFDLNGFDLTATTGFVSTNGSQVTGDGAIMSDNVVIAAQNTLVPVAIDGGYKFAAVTMNTKVQVANDSQFKLAFRPDVVSYANTVDVYGNVNNNFAVELEIAWEGGSKTVTVNPELLAKVYSAEGLELKRALVINVINFADIESAVTLTVNLTLNNVVVSSTTQTVKEATV